MKALLVYPECPSTFWSLKHTLSFIRRKASFPPLGLMTIAPLMPDDWDIKLVDMNVEKLTDEHIRWADMIFLSAMIAQKESTNDVIERCTKHNKKIVAGGPLFTSSPEKFKNIDFLVLNEAEITLPEFLSDLKNNKARRIYQTDKFTPLTETPTPMWSLINLNDYVTMPIQYSRGCPENCEFCDVRIMFGKNPRNKEPKQVIRELQSLYDANWRGAVFVVDDNFIGHKKKAKELLREIIEWQKKHNYPFKFYTEATIRLANDNKLMELMQEANFFKVFIGIETVNLESLKECNKNQNIKVDLAEEVKKIQSYGIQVMAGFIVGFDNDPENVFDDLIGFIQETGIATAMVGLLNALPNTPLWKRLKTENRLTHDSTGENTDAFINFKPRMGKEKLLKGYKRILKTIFEPEFYYGTLYKFLKNYNPTVKSRLQINSFQAFLISIWRIGIISKNRYLYWKILFITLKTKPKALSAIIELIIFGEHFRIVSEKVINNQ